MNNRLTQIFALIETLSEKDGRGYMRFAGRPSFGAYRICRGLKVRCGQVATVVDVGANRGQFAMASRYFFPDSFLYAFEPIPFHAAALRKKLARFSNTQVESKAVGAQAGLAEFHISEYDHLSSLVAPTERRLAESPMARATRTVQVEVVTLDSWFQSHPLCDPVLLKLDVQGFEGEVLAGAKQFIRRVDYLVYESSFEQMYAGERIFTDMFDYVRGLGFELVAPLDFWTGPSGRICEVDLLWRRKK